MLSSALLRPLLWPLLAGRIGGFLPILAQDTSGEGGYPILEWAIVIALVGAAVFVICRTSRRN